MKKVFVFTFLFVFLFLSYSVLAQSNFNMDCYQKYKKCIKDNEEANIPCAFEFCNFEQCICKEMTVPNPMTHMDDTDPGAWGTAITVCSPWSDLISKCVEKHYGNSRSRSIDTKIKTKIEILIKNLENIKKNIMKRRTRSLKDTKALEKIDKQIKNLKKILNERNR